MGTLLLGTQPSTPISMTRKNRLLLAALALAGPNGLSREKLADMFWANSGDKQAQDSLRQTLASVRKALREHGNCITTGQGVVALDNENVWIDVVDFEAFSGSKAANDREQALSLYQGDLLDDFRIKEEHFEAWLLPMRERLRAKAIGMLEEGIDAAYDVEQSIALASRLLEMEPGNETAHRALMRAYASQGRENLALKQFDHCRGILNRDLDVEPSRRTIALFEEIKGKRHRPALDDGGNEDRVNKTGPLPSSEAVSTRLPEKPWVAVLPFANMSSDPSQEYFAEGIAENIITALSKVLGMGVIARNSSFAYKGRSVDLRQVATDLHVRYILEGSIRSDQHRLRISAQLIDANDGGHLWAEQFDRTVDDLFDIQDEITKEIVTALRVNLTDGEEALIWARGTKDVEAWQLCGRAVELIHRFNSTDYLEARTLAEKAVAIDPNYAYARAAMGFN